MQRYGYMRVGAATMLSKSADIKNNTQTILEILNQCTQNHIDIVTLPPFCLTGYTIKDVFLYEELQQSCLKALQTILKETQNADVLFNLTLPLQTQTQLISATVLLRKGKIEAILARKPQNNAFETHFHSLCGNAHHLQPSTCDLYGQTYPLYTEEQTVLFVPSQSIRIQILSDTLPCQSPHHNTIIMNPRVCASCIYDDAYDALASAHTQQFNNVILTSGMGPGESVDGLLFCAPARIHANGTVKSKTSSIAASSEVAFCDIDTQLLNRQPCPDTKQQTHIHIDAFLQTQYEPAVHPDPTPFVCKDKEKSYTRLLKLSAYALKQKMQQAHVEKLVLGVSGGVDSTAALIMAANCLKTYHIPPENLICVTMPGFGTTKNSKTNGTRLAELFNTDLREIDITKAVKQHFSDIGQDENTFDITFENAQARERTQILLDIANKENALVLGTGDLSECVLGWCTFGGDSLSNYSLNHSLPKTLLQDFLQWCAYTLGDFAIAKHIESILSSPITPELLPTKDGELVQKTEDSVGPYELNDFFIYHKLLNRFTKEKILFLAQKAFGSQYDYQLIAKTYDTFAKRIFTQKFKQQTMAAGPVFTHPTWEQKLDIPSNITPDIWQ